MVIVNSGKVVTSRKQRREIPQMNENTIDFATKLYIA